MHLLRIHYLKACILIMATLIIKLQKYNGIPQVQYYLNINHEIIINAVIIGLIPVPSISHSGYVPNF